MSTDNCAAHLVVGGSGGIGADVALQQVHASHGGLGSVQASA
jgi:hypothetical protein